MSKDKKNTVKIKESGVVSNGQGGFFREGTEVEGLGEDTIASLKEKGFI